MTIDDDATPPEDTARIDPDPRTEPSDGREEESALTNDGPALDDSNEGVRDDVAITPTEARRLADSYLAGAATNPERILSLYAEHVNYYEEGRVDRAAVIRDKRNYLSRWPERRYERISDVELTDAGSATLIRFRYEFDVGGGSRRADGIGWAELGVQQNSGSLRIVSERGGVIDRD